MRGIAYLLGAVIALTGLVVCVGAHLETSMERLPRSSE